MAPPGRRRKHTDPHTAAIVERARTSCSGDGNDGVAIFAVSQRRRHYARGLRTRIILRLEDGTPVARLLRP